MDGRKPANRYDQIVWVFRKFTHFVREVFEKATGEPLKLEFSNAIDLAPDLIMASLFIDFYEKHRELIAARNLEVVAAIVCSMAPDSTRSELEPAAAKCLEFLRDEAADGDYYRRKLDQYLEVFQQLMQP
jgi:hypothetical protein